MININRIFVWGETEILRMKTLLGIYSEVLANSLWKTETVVAYVRMHVWKKNLWRHAPYNGNATRFGRCNFMMHVLKFSLGNGQLRSQ